MQAVELRFLLRYDSFASSSDVVARHPALEVVPAQLLDAAGPTDDDDSGAASSGALPPPPAASRASTSSSLSSFSAAAAQAGRGGGAAAAAAGGGVVMPPSGVLEQVLLQLPRRHAPDKFGDFGKTHVPLRLQVVGVYA